MIVKWNVLKNFEFLASLATSAGVACAVKFHHSWKDHELILSQANGHLKISTYILFLKSHKNKEKSKTEISVIQKLRVPFFWICLSSPFIVDHFCQKFVIAQFISERFNYTNNTLKFPLTSKLPYTQWNNCQFPF